MATARAPAAGLKRINLAGISTKSAATKTAKAYPLLPDADGQVAALVEGILEKSEQLEAIEGEPFDIDKQEARPIFEIKPSKEIKAWRMGSPSEDEWGEPSFR